MSMPRGREWLVARHTVRPDPPSCVPAAGGAWRSIPPTPAHTWCSARLLCSRSAMMKRGSCTRMAAPIQVTLPPARAAHMTVYL